MSDSEDSTVTYTAVSSPFLDLLDIRSPGVDGPPVMPEDPYAYVVAVVQAPPFPDYVPGPEYLPLPDFVLESVYPEFIPPEDEVLPAEEQPLPTAASPTVDSPGYLPESNPEEDPEKDDDVDLEEDPFDYPADRGDDGDDEDESLLIAPSAEETEPFETDESAATPSPYHAYHITARISIRDEPPTPFWSDMEVARLLAIPTPPPSPLSPWSSPLPQIHSLPLPPILSPLPVSPPLPVSSLPPASLIRPLGYRAAMIWLRVEALSTSYSLPLPPPIILSHTRSDAPLSGTPPLLPIPLPTSSPPLHLLSTDRRVDRLEVPYLLERDYVFVATMDREIMWDLERDVGYGITDTWDEMLARHKRDLYELDDEQTERQLMVGRLNMLYRDRRAHVRTAKFMEAEARMSREAWGRSMDASDLARAEVMSLRTQVVAQQAVITKLQAADRKRQAAITEMLAADRRRQAQFIKALKLLKRLQTQMTEFERQQGPAKGPA
ncbi:hypothetical protein Tco_0000826 [Tanacetum coccineum]